MEKSQEKIRRVASKLPDTPGVYKFVGKKNEILYIGKATALKSRVKSYFSKDLGDKRGPLISNMMAEALNIKFEKTDSVLEALILEAELIKKFQPRFNSIGKDQKSWNYVVITDEKFPRVLLVREKEITPLAPLTLRGEPKEKFGPFTNSGQLKEALKIIRKIFPFRDKCEPLPQPLPKGEGSPKPCFNYQIGLCPGVCVGAIGEKDYKRTIRHIVQFFEGKKTKIIKELETEMGSAAKAREFEKANEIKRKIFALKHIEDIALIKHNYSEFQDSNFRMEAYDIAHISGSDMVGVMTVMEEGEPKKNGYRMFKIKEQDVPDDTKALREILERRFSHSEWPFPNLIVVDGSTAQLNTAMQILEKSKLEIPIVAVTKNERHKPITLKTASRKAQELAEKYEKEILLANNEAHRFAITFHRRLREKIR